MKFIAQYLNIPNVYTVFDGANFPHARKIASYYRDDIIIGRYEDKLFTIEDVNKKQMVHKQFLAITNQIRKFAIQVGFTEEDFKVDSIECRRDELEKKCKEKYARNGSIFDLNGEIYFAKKKDGRPLALCKIKDITDEKDSSLKLMNEAIVEGFYDKEIIQSEKSEFNNNPLSPLAMGGPSEEDEELQH